MASSGAEELTVTFAAHDGVFGAQAGAFALRVAVGDGDTFSAAGEGSAFLAGCGLVTFVAHEDVLGSHAGAFVATTGAEGATFFSAIGEGAVISADGRIVAFAAHDAVFGSNTGVVVLFGGVADGATWREGGGLVILSDFGCHAGTSARNLEGFQTGTFARKPGRASRRQGGGGASAADRLLGDSVIIEANVLRTIGAGPAGFPHPDDGDGVGMSAGGEGTFRCSLSTTTSSGSTFSGFSRSCALLCSRTGVDTFPAATQALQILRGPRFC